MCCVCCVCPVFAVIYFVRCFPAACFLAVFSFAVCFPCGVFLCDVVLWEFILHSDSFCVPRNAVRMSVSSLLPFRFCRFALMFE